MLQSPLAILGNAIMIYTLQTGLLSGTNSISLELDWPSNSNSTPYGPKLKLRLYCDGGSLTNLPELQPTL